MTQFRKVHYGNYEVSKRGIVRRIQPGQGTHIGKILKPYNAWYTKEKVVKLSYKGITTQIMLKDLIKRVWR